MNEDSRERPRERTRHGSRERSLSANSETPRDEEYNAMYDRLVEVSADVGPSTPVDARRLHIVF